MSKTIFFLKKIRHSLSSVHPLFSIFHVIFLLRLQFIYSSQRCSCLVSSARSALGWTGQQSRLTQEFMYSAAAPEQYIGEELLLQSAQEFFQKPGLFTVVSGNSLHLLGLLAQQSPPQKLFFQRSYYIQELLYFHICIMSYNKL